MPEQPTRRGTSPWVTVLLVQITLSGCASLVKLPELTGDVRGELPIQAYARVLHNCVNDRGEVDFPALRRDRADLERYLAYVARTPASAFSHPQERLAHYINSYNALSMYNVIDLGIPDTHAGWRKICSESFCVYSIGKKIKEILDKAFPNNHIRHRTSCLIENLPAVSSKTHKTCLVNVQGEYMDVALYRNKLLFFNSFGFQTAEDFLYFILAALEQNGSTPEETEIVLAGEIEAGSALFNTLIMYVPKIKFAVHDKSIAKKNDLGEDRLERRGYCVLSNSCGR